MSPTAIGRPARSGARAATARAARVTATAHASHAKGSKMKRCLALSTLVVTVLSGTMVRRAARRKTVATVSVPASTRCLRAATRSRAHVPAR